MDLFLGIDQSLQSPGFALVTEKGEHFKSSTLSVTRESRGVQREAFIRDGLMDFIEGREAQIKAGAIEGFSVNSVHRPFDLGGIFSVLRLYVFDVSHIELMIVPPLSLKKFVTGNGHATKEQVLYSVKTVWGIDFKDASDSADAFGLAKLAWARATNSYNRRCEAEAVHDLFTAKVRVKSRRTHTDV
jgi:crossover junction endodeoxyribonuclease RuvC